MALSADTITAAAMRILSDFGLGDLSMRRLARELDVQPSALYWHVQNKQELFVLIARKLLLFVEAPAPQTAAEAATRLRAVLLGYRDGGEIYTVAYALAPQDLTPPVIDRLPAAATVMSYLLGAVTIEQHRAQFGTPAADSEADFQAGLSALL